MTDRDADIEISKSQGFVIGDYARVFNYFNEAPLPIASAIRSPQQRTLVEERTRNFIGREYVIREIDRVIADPGFESGYVIVVGEPGIGKTALAAFLVLRGAYVHHFNIAPENVRSPRQFLENVCAQLVAKYELDYTTLPPDVGDDAGFLNRLLAEAAARSQERGTGALVIVIDALDEAEDVGLSPGENRLRLPRALPQGVFIVVTTREESDFRLDVDNSRDIWIRDDDPKNEADVAAYAFRSRRRLRVYVMHICLSCVMISGGRPSVLS
jgi:KaiC/GvpD/RAD55 family RecA-like ATPase